MAAGVTVLQQQVVQEKFRPVALTSDSSPHSPTTTSSGCATFFPSDAEKGIEAEWKKLIEREDGFGYQALTEFAAPKAFGVTRVEFEKFCPPAATCRDGALARRAGASTAEIELSYCHQRDGLRPGSVSLCGLHNLSEGGAKTAQNWKSNPIRALADWRVNPSTPLSAKD